jgi:hypothetical protein
MASFAERHTAEIHLLSNFDSYLQRGTILNLAVGDPRKRMPPETETLLVRGFDAYKEKHGAMFLARKVRCNMRTK